MAQSIDEFLVQYTVEHLKLPDREAESEFYYVRTAVDSMRRSSKSSKILIKPRSRVPGRKSYKLACYSRAIKLLFHKRKDKLNDIAHLKSIILETAKTINGGIPLKMNYRGVDPKEVEKAIAMLGAELLLRFNDFMNFDPVESLALIEYRMRYAKSFFRKADRRVSEAIGAFYLMRIGLRLPEYIDWELLTTAVKQLPDTNEPERCVSEITKEVNDLSKDLSFCNWKEAFRSQFRRKFQANTEKDSISDPWNVRHSNARDHRSTTYDAANVTRSREAIDRLRQATGKQPQELVVFKPDRMALHETIAAVVTRIKMINPIESLTEFVINKDGPFKRRILPRVRKALGLLSNSYKFENDRLTFEEYVEYVMDDHFHIVNPNMEIRNELDRFKRHMLNRIESGDYDPRLVESQSILHQLVSDDLLRKYYQGKIRKIVDHEIAIYIKENPLLELPLKPDSERIAWVTIGGPAAGKSSMTKLIAQEYEELVGNNVPLCQINSDHYKPILLPKSDDPEHGNLTWWESGRVRQLIVDRLAEMILAGLAPDFWVSTVTPSAERMKIAGQGNFKVNIYVVSCQVEGPTGAVLRAWKRASDPNDSEDYNRFVPTADLLLAHRDTSKLLIQAIQEKRRDLRLFDTSTRPAGLVASMDAHNRELRVFDPEAYVRFVRKSFIDVNARSEVQAYPSGLTERDVAEAICEYPLANISLNFRYSKNVKHPVLDRDNACRPEDYTEVGAMINDSQSETYMWAGHERAVIRDFNTFVDSLGAALAIELLVAFGKRWPLAVRTYNGRGLLFVNEFKEIDCPAADNRDLTYWSVIHNTYMKLCNK